MKFRATNYEGKEFSFEVPFEASEITFGQYLDFVHFDQQHLTSEKDSHEYMISAIARVAKGDWDELPFSIPGDESIPKGYRITLSDDISVVRLYMHICNVISEFSDYKNEDLKAITIEYKGEKYHCPAKRIAVMLGIVPLNTGEYVEFMELERQLNEASKKVPEGRGDLLGNLEFRMNLKQMAVLLRKEDEKLPATKRERDQFIDERAQHFQDLPLSTVLEVRRFFLLKKIDYIRHRNTGSFSSRRLKRAKKLQAEVNDRSPKQFGN